MKPSTAAPDIRVRRFDADRTDTILTFQEALAKTPDQRQLLWIDVLGSLAPDESARLAKRFDLDPRTRVALEEPGDTPSLAIHGTYFHVRVAAEPTGNARDEPTWFDVIAGTNNVVISRHTGPARFLGDVDSRMDADSSVGALESASFVALLLDSVVTTYFTAVDAVEDEIDELDAQAHASVNGMEMPAPEVYPEPIAFNVIGAAGNFADGDDHTDEERKMMFETHKILEDESIGVAVTCVRVPVRICHSEAVNVQTREPLSADRAREILADAPGVALENVATPLQAEGRDEVFVGRIRRDESHPRALGMWVVSDNLRKGAATNAVQIAELLVADRAGSSVA